MSDGSYGNSFYLGYLLSSMPVHASGRHPVTVVSHGGPEVGADGGSPQDEQGDQGEGGARRQHVEVED